MIPFNLIYKIMKRRTHTPRSLLVLAVVFCTIIMIGMEPCQAETVSASLKKNGKTITLQVSVADPAPTSLIARLHFPAQMTVVSTSPSGAKVDRKAANIKWLVKKPRLGALQFSATTEAAPDFSKVSGVVLFRQPGEGSLITIEARKR